MHFLTNLLKFIHNPLNLPRLSIKGFPVMMWLLIISVLICFLGIIYIIFWIRKIERKVDGFMDYLIKLDDKNYRLWKARLKAEEKG